MTERPQLEWDRFRARVVEFLGVEEHRVERGTHIYDELGIDSLAMFGLGMHLIDCFGIKLPLTDLANIATIGDIFDALARRSPPA